jgi:hypothetical protein
MHDSFYKTFWNRQSYRDRDQIRLKGAEGGDRGWQQRPKRTLCGDGNVLYFDLGGDYTPAYICQNSLNYTCDKANFPVCKLYLNKTSFKKRTLLFGTSEASFWEKKNLWSVGKIGSALDNIVIYSWIHTTHPPKRDTQFSGNSEAREMPISEIKKYLMEEAEFKMDLTNYSKSLFIVCFPTN